MSVFQSAMFPFSGYRRKRNYDRSATKKNARLRRAFQKIIPLKRRGYQPWRVSENWLFVSVVQFNCDGDTRAQLTRDCVLRTSDVMLIS